MLNHPRLNGQTSQERALAISFAGLLPTQSKISIQKHETALTNALRDPDPLLRRAAAAYNELTSDQIATILMRETDQSTILFAVKGPMAEPVIDYALEKQSAIIKFEVIRSQILLERQTRGILQSGEYTDIKLAAVLYQRLTEGHQRHINSDQEILSILIGHLKHLRPHEHTKCYTLQDVLKELKGGSDLRTAIQQDLLMPKMIRSIHEELRQDLRSAEKEFWAMRD